MKQLDIPQRIVLVAFSITALGVLITGRLFFIQIVSGEYYKSMAERQHLSSQILEPRRGNIFLMPYERESFPVATTNQGFLLYIDPRKIEDPEYVFNALERVLKEHNIEIKHDDFIKRASNKEDPFEIVFKRIEKDLAKDIEFLGLAGVGLLSDEWRFYPADNLASHVIGFVGFEGNDLIGRYGIERLYEDVLKGEQGYLEGEKSAGGVFLSLGRRIFRAPHTGQDIVLTIEPNVQIFLEKKLDGLVETWQAQGGGGIIIDPQTGKIIAMAARPDFNPNEYQKEENISVFLNPLVEHIYEMGSIFKPLTMASALDAGKVTPETKYYDHGYVVFDGRRIENYDGEGRGEVDMQQVLNQSLNTGAIFVMQSLGKDDFKKYFLNFGLDEQTGIELPSEVYGNLSNLNSGRDIEYATASFGQGIAVTPLEMAVALSSLANGGNLIRPHIIDSIKIDGALDKYTETKIARRVLKPETSEEITRMLVKVVDEALLGGTVKLDSFSVAAKTGTAQMPKEGERGYSDEYLHSFFGYAPAFDAKFLIFLYLEKPQGVRYASMSLGPAFMDTIKFLLSYYNIKPDR